MDSGVAISIGLLLAAWCVVAVIVAMGLAAFLKGAHHKEHTLGLGNAVRVHAWIQPIRPHR